MPSYATPRVMLTSSLNCRYIALVAICLTVFGCTAVYQPGSFKPPEVLLEGPTGPVLLNGPTQSGSAVPGNLAAPPAGLDNTLPPPLGPTTRNGTYAGAANVLTTAGGMCLNNRRVTNFHVQGDAVRFGEFHGTIGADGGLQMVFRDVWITGRFQGGVFRGQLSENGGIGCTYLLALERVGP
jgi:hypothetical protein